ncbi:phosphatidylserine decarboxylase [Deinococcus arenicola]|uniref:Phosphatidylserine decarboxylase n=1 Tax=Deinococcus arenicola TaxID=2994950 RepID=A0ABU4DM77_9DEIO|nr:phosphatidylserine decarboxylase [Deinococcus sp. ZS9-10]MDV6373541.1 phosphatidylserine decarboxylase [Deinococcus sp. ZS9-10]
MRLRRLLVPVLAGTAVWYLRSVYRFRDPVRVPTTAAGTVLSPADGVVSFVRRVEGGKVQSEALHAALKAGDLLGQPGSEGPAQDGWLVGIFVGPLDVHYVYQAVGGQVTDVQHTGSRSNAALLGPGEALGFLAGQPANLLAKRGTLENERLSFVTQGEAGRVAVTLIAPGAGLNATSYLKQGDAASAGYKAAFLAEGGLVLLHLPAELTPQVSVGERVVGAQTAVAQRVGARRVGAQ